MDDRSAFLRNYRVLARALWEADRRYSAIVAVGAAASGLLPAALMVATGNVVDAVASVVAGDLAAARRGLVATGLFVGVSLALVGIRWMTAWAEARLSQRFMTWVEDRLAAAVLGPLTITHLENPAVTAQISAATEASRENVYYWAVRGFVRSSTVRLTGVVSGAVLLAFAWWAPLLLMAGYGALLLSYVRWEQASADDVTQTMSSSRRQAEYYRELLAEPAAAKEVRVFAMAGWLDSRFGSVWLAAMESVWRRRGRVQWTMALGALGLIAAHVVVVAVLAHAALTGAISVAAVTVFLQAIAGMDGLVSAQYDSMGVSKAGSALCNLQNLTDTLAANPRTASEGGPRAEGPCRVQARTLGFRYPGSDRVILEDVDLTVEPGQSLAIVGPNGAGKSTLTKLLMGLYRPDAGVVLVDGRPADPTSGRVAAVLQSFGRYELSLRDNVTLGLPGVEDDKVHDALRLAGADQLGVDLDAPLASAYEGGTDLSGGQWQRVALARALAAVDRGAGLLILDEPTASLDVRAEVELFDRFLEVTRGMTTIIVSHRLSSVRHADRILVHEDARIVEDGNHDDLLAAGGRYAQMFTLQADRFSPRAATGAL